MTDDELERIRVFAEAAAKPWPSYQEAYAQDVPKLLAEVEYLRTRRLWHRLRFAEMVLDRVGAEVDGIPWREAARLSESLEGEPVTEPVALTKNPDGLLGVLRTEAVRVIEGKTDGGLLAEGFRSLDDWLSKGGALPEAWKDVAPASNPGVKSGD